MATSKHITVSEYIDNISAEQKLPFEKLRNIILKNIDKQFEECINYGMLGYVVPRKIYPEGYHCDPKLPLPFANLAAQKNSINLYHMGLYANGDLTKWFQEAYAQVCKYKLDMGKSCIRFKKYDDIPYELIGELFQKMSAKDWIIQYEKMVKR